MVALPPAQIKKLFAKARTAQTAGEFAQAKKLYARLLKAAPKLAEIHFNLGLIASAEGNFAVGGGHFEKALQLRPGEPAIWDAYLAMAAKHPQIENLRTLLKRVGASLDKHPNINFYRGLVALNESKSEAIQLFRSAIEKAASGIRVHIELADALTAVGDSDAALDAYDQALLLQPENDMALVKKADLLRNLGRYEEALHHARLAVAANPNIGAHYYSYASIKKVTEDDPILQKMFNKYSALPKSDPNIAPLAHALAKAAADTGKSDQYFGFLQAAAENLDQRFPYEVEADRTAASQTQKLYHEFALDQPESDRDKLPKPIFVTGLPRSGTTLIEQILASHSSVDGGGELGLLGRDLSEVLSTYPQAELTKVQLQKRLLKVGDEYRAKLAARFEKPFVTDKSISTYATLGFVRQALPEARFVVVRRHPCDNAFSIYKSFFPQGTHRYSNDLSNIARFMRIFETQIEFWRSEIPDQFIEVRYEDVVSELEAQARNIVSYSGLDWQDSCLDFHKNSRQVDTLSTTQVRQPIYKSSVGAWQHYKSELKPFIETYLSEGGRL